MVDEVRLSPQTVLVLEALLQNLHHWAHGYDIALRTGLKSGTLYPVLMRLSQRGWLESRWEQSEENGRPRHVYRFTPAGRKRAQAVVAERKSIYRAAKHCLA